MMCECGSPAGQGVLEQIALLNGEGFTSAAKAHPAQVHQFKGEGLDFGLGRVKFGVAANRFCGVSLCLIDKFLNRAGDPFRELRSGI